MDPTFIQERITSIKLRIVAYEDAALALGIGGVQQYTLNTGQTIQTVTKFDLKDIQEMIDGLINQLAVYQARLTGDGQVAVTPAW